MEKSKDSVRRSFNPASAWQPSAKDGRRGSPWPFEQGLAREWVGTKHTTPEGTPDDPSKRARELH